MNKENINPKCNSCNCFWKPDETDIKSSGLVYKSCKRCRETQKKYRQANADKLKQYTQENADKIKQYQKQYRQENADKLKQQLQKHYQDNTDKIKQRRQSYYQMNADNIKQYNQNYYQDNAEKMKQYQKQYRQANAEKIKQREKKYRQKKKCEHNKRFGYCKICNTPLYLVNTQRGNLRRCLTDYNLDKIKSIKKHIGCDANYFKNYIQKKMDTYNETADIKMDFTNIHLDHIKPISSFNLDNKEEFLNCSHYTNFQPLLASDNLSKSYKWNDENEAYWNDNIKGKEYTQIYKII